MLDLTFSHYNHRSISYCCSVLTEFTIMILCKIWQGLCLLCSADHERLKKKINTALKTLMPVDRQLYNMISRSVWYLKQLCPVHGNQLAFVPSMRQQSTLLSMSADTLS